MATLDLADGYRTKVWRVVRDALRADPTYENAGIAVVMADDSDPDPERDLTAFGGPVLKFFPALGTAGTFAHEAALRAVLVIDVEALLRTPDAEDLMNLQEALEDTLNPINLMLQGELVGAGALTGQIAFPTPLRPVNAAAPRQDGLIRAAGQFTIEVDRPLTSP